MGQELRPRRILAWRLPAAGSEDHQRYAKVSHDSGKRGLELMSTGSCSAHWSKSRASKLNDSLSPV